MSGDQWRRQDLVSLRHDDRGTEGASIDGPKAPSGVWYGREGTPPQPARWCGGASWAPPAGSGAEPRPLSHFLHVLGHITFLVAKKIRLHCPKIANSTLSWWWWQLITTVTYKVAPMLGWIERTREHGPWRRYVNQSESVACKRYLAEMHQPIRASCLVAITLTRLSR